VTATAAYIRATADPSRGDRLWPADARVFTTNPLSLAYGACGIALFLHRTDGVPDDVVEWLLAQPLSVETYPPGLYVGLAGVAYAFDELDLDDAAESAMRLAYDSPLLFQEANLFLGVAGWGLASLHLHLRKGRPGHLEWARRAGEHLVDTARRDGDRWSWPSEGDEPIHYGFGYGATGIALFLAHLYAATADERFRVAAEAGLRFDLDHRVESELGWAWPRFEGDSQTRPYWIEGSAGIGSVALRCGALLGDDRYLALAERIARDSMVKFTISPGLFEGLSGIGELMIDMHRATGDPAYLNAAADMAETVLWFQLARPGGVAWPGRWLNRIANDLGTGGAGIGLFLDRLLRPGPRLLLDVGEA
jgi:hypothetical protein